MIEFDDAVSCTILISSLAGDVDLLSAPGDDFSEPRKLLSECKLVERMPRKRFPMPNLKDRKSRKQTRMRARSSN